MPVLIVTCGILVGMLSLAAFTPARAGLPSQGGMRAAVSALSDTILVKKNGVPGWWVVNWSNVAPTPVALPRLFIELACRVSIDFVP